VTENSVTHIDREAQSLVWADFSDRSTWMMEFSLTLVFWSCVTLGFFNRVIHNSRNTLVPRGLNFDRKAKEGQKILKDR
jgi:hypothetical protein